MLGNQAFMMKMLLKGYKNGNVNLEQLYLIGKKNYFLFINRKLLKKKAYPYDKLPTNYFLPGFFCRGING